MFDGVVWLAKSRLDLVESAERDPDMESLMQRILIPAIESSEHGGAWEPDPERRQRRAGFGEGRGTS